jgi:hypothetical protein
MRGLTLDLDEALGRGVNPPLKLSDAACELIEAPTAFTRITHGWAEWLVELHRVLADDGRVVAGLADPADFEALAGEHWDESRIGMTVLSSPNGALRSVVFYSEWWLRAHWGRAFEVSIEESDGRRLAVLRRRSETVEAADLERPEPGDARELEAALANAVYLRRQLDRAERRHRGELEEQREEMSRELMRRAFAVADQDWNRRGAGSPAMVVAAEYESTTSWRITKPLRALGRILRRSR